MIYSTLKWKKSVDDGVAFYDDSNIPSVLVQNKIDLLDPNEQDNIDELQQFRNNYFRRLFFRCNP